MKKIFILIILSCFQFASLANTDSEQLERNTRELYNSLSLGEGVPYEHFRSGYLRYLKGRQDQEFSKSIIVFVNFGLNSSEKRLFMVDVANGHAKLVLNDYTTHGSRSDNDHDGLATEFSNISESKQSSLGYFRVGREYQSTIVGNAVKLHGLSGNFNDLAFDPRGIVLHTGWYAEREYIERVGRPGRSSGCFVISTDVWKGFKGNTVGGALLYAFDSTHVFDPGSGEGLLSVSESDTSSSSSDISRGPSAPTLEDDPAFAGAPPTTGGLDNSGTSVAPQTGVEGDSSLAYDGEDAQTEEEEEVIIDGDGSAPHRASANHQNCQKLLNNNVSWNQAAQRAQNGEDPHSFFKGSWTELGQVVRSTDDVTYSAGTAAAQNHLGIVRECASLLIIHDTQNPPQPEKFISADGTQTCEMKSIEDQSYVPCKELVAEYDERQKALKDHREKESQAFSKNAQSELENLNSGINIQDNSITVAADLSKKAQEVADSTSNLQTARLDSLATKLAAMPTYKSTLQKCRSRYSAYQNGGLKEYNAWTKVMVNNQVPTTLPKLVDPCVGAVHRIGVKHIQNKKVKNTMGKFLNELGYKIEDLQSKSSTLGNQTNELLGTKMNGEASEYSKRSKYTFFSPEEEALKEKYKTARANGTSLTSIPSANISGRKIGSIGAGLNGRSDQNRFNKLFAGMNKKNLPTVNNLQFKAESRFRALLKNGKNGRLLSFMTNNGLDMSDIEQAYKSGLINQARYQQLMGSLEGRLGKVTKVRSFGARRGISSVKPGNLEWQVEKDKSKNIFERISHRYFKQSSLFSP